MVIRFSRLKCQQCGRTIDIRKMVEVETYDPRSRMQGFDRMCEACSEAYCEFMRAAYNNGPRDPKVFIHPL